MFAVMDAHRADPSAFQRRRGVLRGELALSSDRKFSRRDVCEKMAKFHWAVHFSHESIKKAELMGTVRGGGFNARPTVAEGWLNQWSVKCWMVLKKPYDPLHP